MCSAAASAVAARSWIAEHCAVACAMAAVSLLNKQLRRLDCSLVSD